MLGAEDEGPRRSYHTYDKDLGLCISSLHRQHEITCQDMYEDGTRIFHVTKVDSQCNAVELEYVYIEHCPKLPTSTEQCAATALTGRLVREYPAHYEVGAPNELCSKGFTPENKVCTCP